jgi:two-component system sensor kinase FixL
MNTVLLQPSDHFLFEKVLRAPRRHVLLLSAAFVVGVSCIDWAVGFEISLGAFYVLPVVIASPVLNRTQIVFFSVVCAVLRVAFNPADSSVEMALRFAMATLACSGSGLFVSELLHSREAFIRYKAEVREQELLRLEAQEQLRALAESSPAAIMTIDGSGHILAANRAAHELLGFADSRLIGESVATYLPVLGDALKFDAGAEEFRTSAQCRGKRRNNELFDAHTWFSIYATPGGPRLAAIAVDTSEDMREREQENFRQLLENNRIVAAAVSHDVRNFCAAIAVVHSNLRSIPTLEGDEDFVALGTLVEGLGRIASNELRGLAKQELGPVDIRAVLEQLRIIIQPSWDDIHGTVEWSIPQEPVMARGEASGLLQVFLNLAHNSHRAVTNSMQRKLSISLASGDQKLVVRFSDSGPGVKDPKQLFQAFQPGANNFGIGLYVSRAILQSYGGDLRYHTTPSPCEFCVELPSSLSLGDLT